MSELFLKLLATADPASNIQAQLLVDTNVALELYSVGDLLRAGDMAGFGTAKAAWRSEWHRYRQLRARYTVVLAWTLATRAIAAGVLGNELVDMTEKVSPESDGTAYSITAGFVHVIMPVLVEHGLRLGALTDVDHNAKGAKADAELLKVAVRDRLPLITNEGLTPRGIVEVRATGKPNLRGLARASGVAVYTPKEYLAHLNVDIATEAKRFVQACEAPVMHAYLDAADKSPAWRTMLEQLVPLYRLILLDEHAPELARVPLAVSSLG